MEPVTTDSLMLLAQRLGERQEQPLRLYLLGGSAMLLLGSPRATKDVDYDDSLRAMFDAILPRAWDADIDPAEFQQYFGELERILEDSER